jgi:hypothetical protein
MTPKRAVKFLRWCGEKGFAGDPLTADEVEMMKEATKVSDRMIRMMGIKPEDYAYTKGEPFE